MTLPFVAVMAALGMIGLAAVGGVLSAPSRPVHALGPSASAGPAVGISSRLSAYHYAESLQRADPLEQANLREQLLSEIGDGPGSAQLRNAIDQLYRPGAEIGNGGTAAALEEEVKLNQFIIRGRGVISFEHFEKSVSLDNNLSKLVRSRILDPANQRIAVEQLDELITATREATAALNQMADIGRDLGFSEVTTAATRVLASTGEDAVRLAETVLEDVAE
jgi:hypothetical protein